MAITGALADLQALELYVDRYFRLPSPASRAWPGYTTCQNYCQDCDSAGHPTIVLGPETRFLCPTCGRTADEYTCACLHVWEVENGTFDENEFTVAIIDAAIAVAAADRTDFQAAMARLSYEGV